MKTFAAQPHIVDVFGQTSGRDQPIMTIEQALRLARFAGNKLLKNDDVAFLNPFCKAGEIILAAAMCSIRAEHKNNRRPILLPNEVTRHMYEKNRFFALSLDERCYHMSLRTFYGNTRSHDATKTKHIKQGSYIDETTGKLNLETFKKELANMIEYIKNTSPCKKIVAIGNPPYQEDDGGHGKSAKPIYNLIIEALIEAKQIDEFVLVIPARWFSTGKGLDKFRERMLQSKNIKKIEYFENAAEVFPSVDMQGGICYLNWTRTKSTQTLFAKYGQKQTSIDTSKYDVLLTHSETHPILDKVLAVHNEKFMDTVVFPRKVWGLNSNYFDSTQALNSRSRASKCHQPSTPINPSSYITAFSKSRKKHLIKKFVVQKNIHLVKQYKVAFPKASGTGKGKRDKVLMKPHEFFILHPQQVSTETYSIAGSFKNIQEAENLKFYLQTYFARFCLGLRKTTQNTSQKTFKWMPYMGVDKKWTDEKLFAHFGLTKKEQAYIIKWVDEHTP